MDGQFLNPFSVDFLRLVDFDVIDQLIQHTRGQLLSSGVLANRRQKQIRGHGLVAQLVKLFPEFFDPFGKLSLFILIASGHFCITFIGQLAGKVIFIDPFK